MADSTGNKSAKNFQPDVPAASEEFYLSGYEDRPGKQACCSRCGGRNYRLKDFCDICENCWEHMLDRNK